MKVRYKIGEFDRPFNVLPGDVFNLTLEEFDNCEVKHIQKISEDIHISKRITHWVMFYSPELGFGGMFGGPNIEAGVKDIFVDSERVPRDKSLWE